MIRILTVLLCLASFVSAQNGPVTGTTCTSISVDGKATVAFQVTGSWSGTIQPQAAVAGQAPANLQVTPSTSSTAQSTVTANGAYFTNVSGYSVFMLCGSTVTNTATIYLN